VHVLKKKARTISEAKFITRILMTPAKQNHPPPQKMADFSYHYSTPSPTQSQKLTQTAIKKSQMDGSIASFDSRSWTLPSMHPN